MEFKGVTLHKNSLAFALFQEWKKQTDPKLQKVARAKFEAHFKAVNETYDKLSVISV